MPYYRVIYTCIYVYVYCGVEGPPLLSSLPLCIAFYCGFQLHYPTNTWCIYRYRCRCWCRRSGSDSCSGSCIGSCSCAAQTQTKQINANKGILADWDTKYRHSLRQ